MARYRAFIQTAVLLTLVSCLEFVPAPVHAADGLPVCDVAGDQDAVTVARATDGSSWVVWRDRRRGPSLSDVYADRLLVLISAPGASPASTATAPPLADGFVACASGTAGPPFAVPADSGDVLILWADSRIPRGIYAQRLRSDGSVYPGWPADGRLITSDVIDLSLAACTDGAGGAYFSRRPPGSSELQLVRLTRITGTGAFAPGWTEAGVVVGGDEQVQGFTLAPDPSGGAVFTARTYFNGMAADLQIGAAGRVSPTGALVYRNLPGWRSGNFAPGNVGSVAFADGLGGFVAAWNDAPAPEFYAQRWDAAGTKQWPDSLAGPHMDFLVADGAGGMYLVGREKQDLNRLSVLRRDADGAVSAGWDPGGSLLADPAALGNVGAFGGSNGVFVYWAENRLEGTGFDIRASSVRANGRLGFYWVPGGDPICDAAGNQINVVGAPGSQILAWVDERNLGTSGRDVWATYLMGPIGGVGVEPPPVGVSGLSFRSVFPNPARGSLRVALAVTGSEPVRLELVDVRGRIVRDRVVWPESEAIEARLEVEGLVAGLYWIRATQGARTAHARVVVLR